MLFSLVMNSDVNVLLSQLFSHFSPAAAPLSLLSTCCRVVATLYAPPSLSDLCLHQSSLQSFLTHQPGRLGFSNCVAVITSVAISLSQLKWINSALYIEATISREIIYSLIIYIQTSSTCCLCNFHWLQSKNMTSIDHCWKT